MESAISKLKSEIDSKEKLAEEYMKRVRNDGELQTIIDSGESLLRTTHFNRTISELNEKLTNDRANHWTSEGDLRKVTPFTRNICRGVDYSCCGLPGLKPEMPPPPRMQWCNNK